MKIQELMTPAVLVDYKKVCQNIERAISVAKCEGKKLRPHIKTHKSGKIAKMQTAYYSEGICVSKLSEAIVMLDKGITDILIANEVVGENKIKKLLEIASKGKLSVLVDSEETLNPLIEATSKEDVRVGVLVELECGDERCGTDIENAIKLARRIIDSPRLDFLGLELFGGFVFHTVDSLTMEKNTIELEEFIKEAKQRFDSERIDIPTISVGGSPSFERLSKIKDITELRPGVYVFNDGATVSRGGATWNDCALSVLTTVISVNREKKYAVLDGGGKTFSYCCPGVVFGNKILYGVLKKDHKAILKGLSEEHGILDISDTLETVKVGDVVEIIPSHACPVVNLCDEFYVVHDGVVIDEWPVDARGKTR